MNVPKEKHDHKTLKFPEGFLWGAATSAHQVEGNNTNSDWWEWEQKLPEERHSGRADNQYELYEQDFDLAKSLSHNAHRLSIEWARIEPEEGKFDEKEIEHYVKVLKSLKDRGLKVMLTLHHFTNPIWFSKKGGWESFRAAYFFNRFVNKIIAEVDPYVDLYVTINEPGVYAYMSYLVGVWPPQKTSKRASFLVLWNMAQAHKKVYKTIKRVNKNAQVGIAHNVQSFNNFHKHSLREDFAVWVLDLINNHLIYWLTGKGVHDFIGLNYYQNKYISFNGESNLPSVVDITITKKDVSDMGWEVRPEGIFDVIMDFSDYHLPIYITENGLAATNDDRRCRFLISYLKEIYHALESGVNVLGYFHWSLIDNFEWADGYTPRFGLIEVDYETKKRTPRNSSYVYQAIIETNGIPHHLLRFIGHTVQAEEILCRKHDGPKALCEHVEL